MNMFETHIVPPSDFIGGWMSSDVTSEAVDNSVIIEIIIYIIIKSHLSIAFE